MINACFNGDHDFHHGFVCTKCGISKRNAVNQRSNLIEPKKDGIYWNVDTEKATKSLNRFIEQLRVSVTIFDTSWIGKLPESTDPEAISLLERGLIKLHEGFDDFEEALRKLNL